MSTPQPPSTAGPHDGERRKSLGKYVKRMSSVFKREKSGRGVSTLSSVPSEPTTSADEQHQSGVETKTTITDAAATQAVAQEPTEAESTTQAEPTENKSKSSVAAPAAADLTLTPTTSIHVPIPAPTQPAAVLDRNAMQRERARALFAKYGLTLEPHEFIVTSAAGPLVPRVEKPIRMRVHRSCHQCGTLYGHDKVCVQCEHRRCKQCPKYPKKKSSGEKGEKGEKGAAKDDPEQPRKKKLLTVTTRYGKELAYQPATQRVRRTCHKCDALFSPATATTCESCSHVRCTKCPREPAKRNKWPAGYPGDAEPESEDEADAERAMEQFRRIWRKPRRIVRWECEQCHSLFRQGSHLCPGCGHERCDDCSRSPIKKPRSEESFDPAVVAAVEAKLRALGVDSTDDAPSSEPEHH